MFYLLFMEINERTYYAHKAIADLEARAKQIGKAIKTLERVFNKLNRNATDMDNVALAIKVLDAENIKIHDSYRCMAW